MTNINQILDHAAPRPRPTLPEALRKGRMVEIGLTYEMGRGLVRGSYTGMQGRVVAVCQDGDVEVELSNGRGLFVYHSRLRSLSVTGEVGQSLDERAQP